MLAQLSSREITEWQAYEQYAGPLGGGYEGEMLAQVNELLQAANYLFQMANSGKGAQKPPEPKRVARPGEWFDYVKKLQAARDAREEAAFMASVQAGEA
ncbi:hypothetical protein [Streptomyces sp. NPDC001774]